MRVHAPPAARHACSGSTAPRRELSRALSGFMADPSYTAVSLRISSVLIGGVGAPEIGRGNGGGRKPQPIQPLLDNPSVCALELHGIVKGETMLSRRSVLLSLLVLPACVTQREASRDAAFDGAPDKAVVVIGIATTVRPDQKDGAPGFVLDWARVGGGGFSIEQPAGAPGQGDIRHRVIVTEPGEYRLQDITEMGTRGIRRTKVAGSPTELVLRAPPGRVTYVGDMVVNVNVFPASIARMALGEAAARTALAGYPGIKGPMGTLPLQWVPGKTS